MRYFQPKGEKAEAQMVYDHLRTLDVGALASYSDLSEVLDRDFLSNRGPIYEAQKRLEKNDKRTLICISKQGYQIAEANQHEALAKMHLKKSGRQMVRAKRRAKSADRSRLTKDEKLRIEAIELNLSQLHAIQRSQARRIDKIEKTVKTTDRKVETHGSELEQVQERLSEMEALLAARGFADVKKRRKSA